MVESLDSSIISIPVQNWRRLEEYLSQARQLKAAGMSQYFRSKHADAYLSLRAFGNLMRSLESHNAFRNPAYRRDLFVLNNDVPRVNNIIAECRSILSASSSPSTLTRSALLKKLVIPQELIDNFIAQSFANTENNKETLGILGGVSDGDDLKIKGLILPKQSGASDCCECRDDELMFAALEKEKWEVLGWIHTHPQHDLFLSGVDVHTHANYQYFLPEAVAIVYAPNRNPSLGIFQLTTQGIDRVRECQKTGLHPDHAGHYQQARNIQLVTGERYKVIDQR